ncbi:MAG: hypothetical protein E7292_00200 [Lachnospiraceae bacterium]|nr:hypothetical protein [Lachnospiraceae bacterium]
MSRKAEKIEPLQTTTVNVNFEREQILNMSFKEMGMSRSAIYGFRHCGISTLNDFLAYYEKKKRCVLCDGKWLGRKTLEELLQLLKEHNWEWVLQDDISDGP